MTMLSQSWERRPGWAGDIAARLGSLNVRLTAKFLLVGLVPVVVVGVFAVQRSTSSLTDAVGQKTSLAAADSTHQSTNDTRASAQELASMAAELTTLVNQFN